MILGQMPPLSGTLLLSFKIENSDKISSANFPVLKLD